MEGKEREQPHTRGQAPQWGTGAGSTVGLSVSSKWHHFNKCLLNEQWLRLEQVCVYVRAHVCVRACTCLCSEPSPINEGTRAEVTSH